jgi:chemotaxis response regulator CheB
MIRCYHLAALIASAGKPAARNNVSSSLPTDLPTAIVVAQHLDSRRRSSMADTSGPEKALGEEAR